jgi:sn-glycerol 3-phosphate transport system substrate-binding protein
MKKVFCIAMTALCISAALFAGGGSDRQAAGGNTKIVLWHSMGGRNGEALDKLAREFNASQDKIEIEMQYQGTYDDCIVKIRATPKGQGPDILQLYDIGTRWAVDSGLTLKMQDFIDRDKYDISDYEPNILAYYALDGSL